MLVIENLDYFSKEMLYGFLSLIDNLIDEQSITLIGATSALDKVDLSFRRGGRFDFDIRMEMDDDTRLQIFVEYLRLVHNEIDPEDLKMLSRVASGFVTADIA